MTPIPNNVAALAEEVKRLAAEFADWCATNAADFGYNEERDYSATPECARDLKALHAAIDALAACAAQREKDAERFQKLGRLVGLGFWGACEIEVLDSFGRCETHWVGDVEDLRSGLDKAHDYPAAAPVATPKEGA